MKNQTIALLFLVIFVLFNLCQCSIIQGCRPDNTTSTDCTGRGQCVSGICECVARINPEELIYGKYCECDNFSCGRNRGLLCSGPDQGVCECGRCLCKSGWTGDDCSCEHSINSCISPNDGEICSGHGDCICGSCKCHEKQGEKYYGRYCEKCLTCPDRCFEFKDCVQCQMYKTGPMANSSELCAANCTLFTSKSVETLPEDDDHRQCIFYDESDCRFEFAYNDHDVNSVKLLAKEKLDCPSISRFASVINWVKEHLPGASN